MEREAERPNLRIGGREGEGEGGEREKGMRDEIEGETSRNKQNLETAMVTLLCILSQVWASMRMRFSHSCCSG